MRLRSAFTIEVDDGELIGALDLVQVMHVQLDRVERAVGALAIRGIESEMLHDVIDGVAHHHAIIRIPQMAVVIDPIGFDGRSISGGSAVTASSQ